MKPITVHKAIDSSLARDLIQELKLIGESKQGGNPAYRSLLGDPGIYWQYADTTVLASKWTPTAARIRDIVSNTYNQEFNSATGYYHESNGVVFPHSDYSFIKNISSPFYVVLGLGGSRTLIFKDNITKIETKYFLGEGSLLMIPKEYDLSSTHYIYPEFNAEPGASLTFRNLTCDSKVLS